MKVYLKLKKYFFTDKAVIEFYNLIKRFVYADLNDLLQNYFSILPRIKIFLFEFQKEMKPFFLKGRCYDR